MQLTTDQWNQMINNKEVEDISHELPSSFLVIYQVMRAKIIWQGKKWYANAWAPPQQKTFITLEEIC